MGSTRARTFFAVRVGVLLCVLFGVVLYAVRDVRSRSERNAWERTLDVAIVVVHAPGDAPVDPAAVDALVTRADALSLRLEAELQRLRRDAQRPFRFHVSRPVDAPERAPAPASDGLLDLAEQAWAMSRWLAVVDPRAGVVPDHYDSRIYVVARPPGNEERSFVEGRSEQGGRIGVVEVDLDTSMVDFALFVVAHELFHTLGATDKYDVTGRSVVPEGLVDPSASPLYPQRAAEVMARNVPVSATSERVPTSLDDLGVGPVTAREIGWVR